jgi:hypothetical protein
MMDQLTRPTHTKLDSEIEALFAKRRDDKEEIRRRQIEFDREGYTRFGIGELVPEHLMAQVQAEAEEMLAQFAIRRDLNLATTGYSPRRMSNVPQRFTEAHGTIIPALYNSPEMRAWIGAIVGDEVLSCYKDEEYVINRLEVSGDTHGWHWGDYPYTMIWVLQAPPMEQGGLLQCLPHTRWHKDDPRPEWYIANCPMRSYYHATGEAYLIRSDTTLHRVTTVIGENCTRIILNTCWAGRIHPGNQEHETVQSAFV